ncbi:aminoglycoside phosphotransferase family protein [Paenibacillus mendelii]|uniref:Aminoglycoside phosphotransferase family protein n=1 Tax=Paenibacillus mendelii TaxID=206163 RepID=A0ABV6JKI5_9BACL|nr:aminoglycoside phosphotransferase family protein [Paenibacillus mendelii]MCQ6563059.1 aminoglycoside phosphotransferase family protein [Paenibacillus mendelii]
MNALQTILSTHYGLENVDISPQQGGWAALAYKVTDNKQSYFLKAYDKERASTSKWTALIDSYVPITVWLMNNTDLHGKIPVPIQTNNGFYKCEDDHGIYLLYAYIDGETIGKRTLTKGQIHQFSAMLSELHSYGEEIPLDTHAIKEHFHAPFVPLLKDALNKEYDRLPSDVRERLDPYVETIKQIIVTFYNLSECLKNTILRMALCHTDLHNWNLMQAGGQLMLIDWEGLKLAPVEADLMFLTDKPYFDEFMTIYRKSHPDYVINPNALLFYQIRRKLEDLWEWIEQLAFDSQTEQERADTHDSLQKELEELDSIPGVSTDTAPSTD